MQGELTKDVHQRNDPLQDGRLVVLARVLCHAKRNSQSHLDNNKASLDDEARKQQAVLAVRLHSHLVILLAAHKAQQQVLDTDAYGTNHITRDKHAQQTIVDLLVVGRVEDGEQDEARGADNGPKDGEDGHGLFPLAVVGHKAALVAQPALAEEDEVKGDDHDG